MKCVIFDLDGTLVDSEPLSNQAIRNLLPDLNDSLASLVDRYRGMKLATVMTDIEQRLDRKLPASFEVQYRREVAELFECYLQSIPGALEMLSYLPNPKCVASSGPLPKIEQSLSLTGLAQYFGSNLFSSYEIRTWKPDPGLFLHAAKEMGYAPGECIVVEDSEIGISAAAAAGMNSILYSPTGSGSARYCVAAMSQLPGVIESV